MIETIIKLFGVGAFMIGILILSSLQIRLSRRLNRSLFTFLPVLTFPIDQLSASERQRKRIGIYLLVAGALVTVIMNSNVLFDSFVHFNDPPAILRK